MQEGRAVRRLETLADEWEEPQQMDAAVLAWTDEDRRRMRMGELTAATRGQARRVRQADDVTRVGEPTVEGHENTEEESAAHNERVAREKAEWREYEARRRAFEQALRQNMGETGKLAAQNGIPQFTAQYAAQREMRLVEAEKNQAAVDVQVQLGASSAHIQSLVSQTHNGATSWEYRKSVLGRARTAVADHLATMHQVYDRCFEKLAQFAGKPDIVSALTSQASDVEQRKRVMEEYYSVLERIAGTGSDEAGLDRLSNAAATVAPEVVRNSSTMRQMARRRRNFWAEVA